MIAGILMAGGALVGLAHMTALWMFYLFYILNALGYVAIALLSVDAYNVACLANKKALLVDAALANV